MEQTVTTRVSILVAGEGERIAVEKLNGTWGLPEPTPMYQVIVREPGLQPGLLYNPETGPPPDRVIQLFLSRRALSELSEAIAWVLTQ